MTQPEGVEATRRELMRAALVGGLAGTAMLSAPAALAQAQSDAELVPTLLGSEMLAVFAYSHAVRSGTLGVDSERLVRRLLGQERTHQHLMAGAVLRLGGTPPPALRTISDADKLLAASGIAQTLSQVRSEEDIIRLLIHLEVVLERGYYVALSKLQDPGIQTTAAQVLASEAQHQTVLIDFLFPGDTTKSVPEAFVEGNPGDGRV